jgi:hypothetical protein
VAISAAFSFSCVDWGLCCPAATLHSFTDALVPDGHAEPSAGPAASPHAQTTPTDASVGSESEWGMARDPSTGGVYYYNKATGSVQWEPPVGWKTGHKLHHKLGQRTSAEQRPGAGTTQPAQVQRQVYDNPIDMVQAAIARKRQVHRNLRVFLCSLALTCRLCYA